MNRRDFVSALGLAAITNRTRLRLSSSPHSRYRSDFASASDLARQIRSRTTTALEVLDAHHGRRVELPCHGNDCAAEAAPKNRCHCCDRAAAAPVDLTIAMDEGIDSYSDGSA